MKQALIVCAGKNNPVDKKKTDYIINNLAENKIVEDTNYTLISLNPTIPNPGKQQYHNHYHEFFGKDGEYKQHKYNIIIFQYCPSCTITGMAIFTPEIIKEITNSLTPDGLFININKCYKDKVRDNVDLVEKNFIKLHKIPIEVPTVPVSTEIWDVWSPFGKIVAVCANGDKPDNKKDTTRLLSVLLANKLTPDIPYQYISVNPDILKNKQEYDRNYRKKFGSETKLLELENSDIIVFQGCMTKLPNDMSIWGEEHTINLIKTLLKPDGLFVNPINAYCNKDDCETVEKNLEKNLKRVSVIKSRLDWDIMEENINILP